MLGLPEFVAADPVVFNVWSAIEGSRGLEVSGAAATDNPDQAVLVSDNQRRHLIFHNLTSNTLTPLSFTETGANEIDDLEALTRRPSDGKYFMTSSLSVTAMCPPRGVGGLRFGSFFLASDRPGEFTVENFVVRPRNGVPGTLRNAIANFLSLGGWEQPNRKPG